MKTASMPHAQRTSHGMAPASMVNLSSGQIVRFLNAACAESLLKSGKIGMRFPEVPSLSRPIHHPAAPRHRARSLRGPGRGGLDAPPGFEPRPSRRCGGLGVRSPVGSPPKRLAGHAQIGTQKVRSCAKVVRYRNSTLGLVTVRRSQRGKCSASRSGGETNFLHFGQTTVACPMRLSFPALARCFFMTQQ
jgi:hypothetical protein